MSELQENKSHIFEARGALQTIQTHGLIKVNRILLFIVLSLMALVLILGFLLFPDDAVGLRHKSASRYRAELNPVLTADVDALKAQMIGLVSGSIESKLRVLEESIRMGAAANSLGTIQDLKNDVRVLRSYSQPAEKIEKADAVSEELLKEISQLKQLIYVSLASCGLMLAAVAGIWLKNSNKLTYIKVITHYLGRH
ncbi:MAG: hypothetical protein ACU841_04460 [Gammaproteobacteria bacterium]